MPKIICETILCHLVLKVVQKHGCKVGHMFVFRDLISFYSIVLEVVTFKKGRR